MIAPDEDLIRSASLKATGATIHDVNGVIGFYRAACAGPENAESRAWRKRGASILADFCIHGDIVRAKRDHPVPKLGKSSLADQPGGAADASE